MLLGPPASAASRSSTHLDQLGSDTPPACLPALVKIWSSGQPPILTIVSPEGRARLDAWLPGMAATFDVLTVAPLEGDALRDAVAAAAPAILGQPRVGLTAGARLPELTRLADRFLGGLALPGRALALLDLACARTVREGRSQLARDTWIDIVCERSGIPRERIEVHGNQEVLDLEGELGRRVVGHDHAIKALSDLIRRPCSDKMNTFVFLVYLTQFLIDFNDIFNECPV